MGIAKRIEAKTDRIKGRYDEERGKKKGDQFLAASGRAAQRKAREIEEAESHEKKGSDDSLHRGTHF